MDKLPTELLFKLSEWLEGRDLMKFSQLNRHCRDLCTRLHNAAVGHKETLKVTHFGMPAATKTHFQYQNGNVKHGHSQCKNAGSAFVSRFPLAFRSDFADQHSPANALYFEATILSQQSFDWPLTIGLVSCPSDSSGAPNPAKCPPGSIPNSVGYSSKEGFVALYQTYEEMFQFAPRWRVGDVVGCGYSKYASENGSVFFTLNGCWVGDAPYRVMHAAHDYRQMWFAAVGSAGPASVELNFGQKPFRYNVTRHGAPHLLERYCPDEMLDILDVTPRMEPNVLPSNADPYPSPVVNKHTITFPVVNGCNTSRSCLGNVPIGLLSSSNLAYFEVRIIYAVQSTFFSVGLAEKPYSPFHQIGWDKKSVGYHSDDGRVFHSTQQAGLECAPQYGEGCVIGCGYDKMLKRVFFTRNGGLIRTLFNCDGEAMYPAIASNNAWVAEVNFGQKPFEFNLLSNI